jgi:hypothetical protein
MRSLLASLLLALPAAAAAPEVPSEFSACTEWQAAGLPEGPVTVGLGAAELGAARHACPHTELALGARLGAIIDTPNFYGNLGASALVSGSWAVRDDLELFGTLEAVNFTYVQNASLKQTQLTLGSLTVGASRIIYDAEHLVGAATARLLFPTSLESPGVHPVGAEVGHTTSFRSSRTIEVHSYLGLQFNAALGPVDPHVQVAGLGVIGFQYSPWSFFSLVIDAQGRLGQVSYLGPAVALRFRIASLGIELGGTLPIAGNDRHDFISGARFSWRF